MEEMTANPEVDQPGWRKYLVPVVVLVIVILVGILAYATISRQAAVVPPGTTPISQSTLEEQYGLRVNLIAVTAAGGMVDLRLKILDAAKARLLLQDTKVNPVLIVAGSGVTLPAPEDSQAQDIKLENGGVLFFLFPNVRNVIKPGVPVTVKFGDVSLEPIPAK